MFYTSAATMIATKQPIFPMSWGKILTSNGKRTNIFSNTKSGKQAQFPFLKLLKLLLLLAFSSSFFLASCLSSQILFFLTLLVSFLASLALATTSSALEDQSLSDYNKE